MNLWASTCNRRKGTGPHPVDAEDSATAGEARLAPAHPIREAPQGSGTPDPRPVSCMICLCVAYSGVPCITLRWLPTAKQRKTMQTIQKEVELRTLIGAAVTIDRAVQADYRENL